MYQKKRKKQKKRKEKFKTIQERYVHVEKKTRTECMSIRRSDQKERGKKRKNWKELDSRSYQCRTERVGVEMHRDYNSTESRVALPSS